MPRAWAKKMVAKALIRTVAVDHVAGRIVAARALPSLRLGDSGLDSLTVYGFFRDFSIEVGETVSKLSLSIKGLSKAVPIVPISPGGSVASTMVRRLHSLGLFIFIAAIGVVSTR